MESDIKIVNTGDGHEACSICGDRNRVDISG